MSKNSNRLPAGVTKETAAAINAVNSLLVNVPESNNIKGDKKGGPKEDANSVTERAAVISAVTLGSEIVFDVIRRYSGIILPAIYDKTAAAGLLRSKATKEDVISAAVLELEKATTLESICKAITRADNKIVTREKEAAKRAAEKAQKASEKEAKKTAKKNAIEEAKKAVKMSPDEFKAKRIEYYTANGVPEDVAANLANLDYNNMYRK